MGWWVDVNLMCRLIEGSAFEMFQSSRNIYESGGIKKVNKRKQRETIQISKDYICKLSKPYTFTKLLLSCGVDCRLSFKAVDSCLQ